MSLHISPELELQLDAVTETFAILAVKRAGKSNAAVVMAEEMYDAGVPWVAVDPKGDWWGVRAAGDGQAPGLSVLVFGGLHGDVPLEPTAGNLVADLIAEQRVTCVLDVSEMSKADQRRFLTDFAGRLYRRNTEPLHVFCEEADEYIPQRVMGESAKLVGAFETLVKRGGFRGIGVTLITQRSASLNKDVLTQAGTLIAMRTPSPQDRKAVLAWIDYHAASKDVIDELPTLPSGTAWLFSSGERASMTKLTFRRRRTFDSGSTPKVGGKPRPPVRLADVDLAAIKEAMADTIERAKADDPRELRKRIRELETALANAESVKPEPVVERVEVPAISDEELVRLEDLLAEITHAADSLVAHVGAAIGPVAKVINEIAYQRGLPDEAPTRTQTPVTSRPRAQTAAPAPRPRAEPPRGGTFPAAGDGPINLRAGARRMVESLGRMHPLHLTTGQWGMVAHLKTTGGTWSTYLSELKRGGLVEQDSAGWFLTDAGFDYIGGRPAPMTARELQDHYRTILRAGAVKMLDAIIRVYPRGLTRDELGEQARIVTTGGTFSTYLSELIRNGLAERVGEKIRATEILMHGAEA